MHDEHRHPVAETAQAIIDEHNKANTDTPAETDTPPANDTEGDREDTDNDD